MKKISLILEIHQPFRLNTYRFFEIRNNHYYYNDYENEFNTRKISEESYMPVNRILSDLIHYSKGDFRVSFLFSGTILDLFELYVPEMLESFKDLLDTGCAELISGTYSNSFGPLMPDDEFNEQVRLQNRKLQSIFSKKPPLPTVRDHYNYHNRIISPVVAIIPEHGDLYRNAQDISNDSYLYDLSSGPEKLVKLLTTDGDKYPDTITIFLPYHLFGDNRHNKNVLQFLEQFPVRTLSKYGFTFITPPEAGLESALGIINTDNYENKRSDKEVFCSQCNDLQISAVEKLYTMSEKIEKCNDPSIYRDWLYLQACDHFYFMNPAFYKKRELYGMFVPYSSHFFAYINFMNVLADFSDRLDKSIALSHRDQEGQSFKKAGFNRDNPFSVFSGTKKKNSGKRLNEIKTLIK